ncbi:hypothetical protein AB434_0511 [Heyndrickxia coagulans]|uniref:Uncharacterized protein n=1 Tax=Heyndrickxia coagulans TaxID=1398 RepID=A0AAN0T479_HEYCO|nr:hypothetical protein SB48_HM08orf01018 [Heyndrickxia coagulans]AKN52916.1 hypothetical protein AB434_0511 [Heyndrickxia coagulans]
MSQVEFASIISNISKMDFNQWGKFYFHLSFHSKKQYRKSLLYLHLENIY